MDTNLPSPHNGPAVDLGPKFLADIRSFADRGEDALTAALEARWSRPVLVKLLGHVHPEVARSAAIALGLIGQADDTPALADALHHDDYFVVMMAERAMWSIWMRASSSECNALLREAIAAIHACDFTAAERILDRILILDADFAEAVNQRAVMLFLTGRYESSTMACHRALALNPHHFGAAAGLGHNHVQRGQHRAALAAYRRALRLHPRMEGVRQALRQSREALADDGIPLRWPQPTNTILSFAEAARQARAER
jgi:tetratricopeptide (TPR) repeat protein